MLLAIWIFGTTIVSISALRTSLPPDASASAFEFLKLVLGPGLGAGIAFYVNDYVHKQRKKTDERTAIFGAVYAIGAMYDDFLNFKWGMREGMAEHEAHFKAHSGAAPTWAYARPNLFTFNEGGFPNLASLQFLLNRREGRESYQQLQHLIRAYRNLSENLHHYNDATQEMQSKMSAATELERSSKSGEEIIGLKISTAVSNLLMGIVERIEKDGALYVATLANLIAASDKYLGEKTGLQTGKIDNEKFHEKNMPPLPKDIADQLAAMR